MIDAMTSPVPRPTTRVAGRPAYPGRLTVRPPAPPPSSKRGRFARSFSKAFFWRGWKTIGAVAASLVAICTAIVAIATFVVSERTLDANTRSQTSDRFGKAIEQLGNDKSLDVRIGGIYGLEQLARDTPSDHPAVFDVLTAFVRHRAPAGSGKCTDPTLHLGDGDQSPNASPDADVQAAVAAIARRDRKNDREDQFLDLSHTCLVAAKWSGLQLAEIALVGADLRSAHLDLAHLDQAFLNEANLSGARLRHIYLTGAFLIKANLTGADLFVANLNGAHLGGANLSGVKLSGADLYEAHLDGTNLSNISYDTATIWPNGFRPPPSRPH
jgi:hypothetical protein